MRVTNWISWGDGTWLPWVESNLDSSLAKKAIIEAIRENGYAFSGAYHQLGEFGVPIIDDKYRYETSILRWSELMADALGNHDPGAYIDYAAQLPHGMKEIVPDVKIIQKTIRFVGKKELS